MKLLSCHIENFGKLSDVDVDFTEGFNSFCESNGWGKSTFATFIRVMFFGFEGEKKKDDFENERKRFKPWQMGAYGGSITFEKDGREYIVSRRFGEKASSDFFDLKNAETGLNSYDFSEKLGEEIFKVNSQAFARTIFTSQRRLKTEIDEDISSRLGNIADNLDDLDCYDMAMKKLTDYLNKNSIKNKTGAINKMVSVLEEERTAVRAGDELNNTILEIDRELENYREEEREKKHLLEEKRNYRKEVISQTNLLIKKKEYDSLVKARDEKQEKAVKPIREGSIPTQTEVRAMLSEADELTRLTGELQQLQMKHFEMEKNISEEKKKLDRISTRYHVYKKVEFVCFGIAAILIIAAIVLLNIPVAAWLLDFGVLAVVFSVSFYYLAKRLKRHIVPDFDNDTEFEELSRKLDETKKEIEYKRSLMEEFVRKYGGKNLNELLMEAGVYEKELELCSQAEKELLAAKEELDTFVRLNSDIMKEIENADFESSLPSPQVIDGECEEIDARLGTLAGLIRDDSGRLDTLNEKYEEWQKSRERVSELESEIEIATRRYNSAKEAAEMLELAKQKLNIKYRNPIMERFSYYYSIITKTDAGAYQIDANNNLSVEEVGLPRSIEYLSEGYKDLIGFSLRLALVDLIFEAEEPFLVFDDPFTELDSEKRSNAIELLHEVAKSRQVIYFSQS